MKIGIIGSGLMGGKLGTIFARAGHEVIFSYAPSKEKLNRLSLVAHGNARPGTPSEAARETDAVLLAVYWLRIHDVLNQTGDLPGNVIITCSLPMNAENTELVVAYPHRVLAKRICEQTGKRDDHFFHLSFRPSFRRVSEENAWRNLLLVTSKLTFEDSRGRFLSTIGGSASG